MLWFELFFSGWFEFFCLIWFLSINELYLIESNSGYHVKWGATFRLTWLSNIPGKPEVVALWYESFFFWGYSTLIRVIFVLLFVMLWLFCFCMIWVLFELSLEYKRIFHYDMSHFCDSICYDLSGLSLVYLSFCLIWVLSINELYLIERNSGHQCKLSGNIHAHIAE